MAVNSNNKRQNYDISWNHIEVCNEKWCYMTIHQVCNNSNTTGVSSGTWPITLPEHMSSPHSVHVLEGFVLFILSNYISMSSRFRSVIDVQRHDLLFFFTPICFLSFFGSSRFFKMLFAFTDVQHDFHVRWCSWRLTGTRRVSQVGKELITFRKTWVNPWFSVRFVVLNLCRSLFANILLLITSFDIFKLFYAINKR